MSMPRCAARAYSAGKSPVLLLRWAALPDADADVSHFDVRPCRAKRNSVKRLSIDDGSVARNEVFHLKEKTPRRKANVFARNSWIGNHDIGI